MSDDQVMPVLLVAHGPLASGLRDAIEMIAGPQERMEVVQLLPEDDVEGVSDRLEAALRELGVEQDGEAVIFADLFGAAPANAAASLLRHRPNIEIVAGMNLPMLLESLLGREGVSARELAQSAVAAGRESVRDVGEVIRTALAASKSAGGNE
jgi:mannose/fructose/sorbose-specific phosphotransferase system IIA component